MVKITFIGTGEAFDPDPKRANSSYLIDNGDRTILVDCGYRVPFSLMHYLQKQDRSVADIPDTILFTHGHGDHFAGLPALLMMVWEEVNGVVGDRRDGLNRKIQIATPDSDVIGKVIPTVKNQYQGFYERFGKEGPDILYNLLERPFEVMDNFHVTYAKTSHGAVNHAYRFEDEEGNDFAISGDGALSGQSRELFSGVGLLIHEGFSILGDVGENHASAEQVVRYAAESNIGEVAIVHVNRQERKKSEDIHKLEGMADELGVCLSFPQDHEAYIF